MKPINQTPGSIRSELAQIQGTLNCLKTQISALEAPDTATQRKVEELQKTLAALEKDPTVQPTFDRLDVARQDLRNHQLLSLLGAGLGFVLFFLVYVEILTKEPFKESYSAGILFTAFLDTLLFLTTYGVMTLLGRGLATSSARIAALGSDRRPTRFKAGVIAIAVFVTSLFVGLCKTLPRRDGYYDNEILKSWLGAGFSGTVGFTLLYYADVIVVVLGVVVTSWILRCKSDARI